MDSLSYDECPHRPMTTTTGNYLANLTRLMRGNRLLRPLVVAYYVTTQCNFNCAYCEDFGQERNEQGTPSLPLKDALRLLRVIRHGTDRLILTGGDPLLYPDLLPLVAHARQELSFRHLTLQTNGLLLAQHQDLLPLLDRLVISLDSTDPELSSSLSGVPEDLARTVLDNLRTFAPRQR